jgi:hypothetical protein
VKETLEPVVCKGGFRLVLGLPQVLQEKRQLLGAEGSGLLGDGNLVQIKSTCM